MLDGQEGAEATIALLNDDEGGRAITFSTGEADVVVVVIVIVVEVVVVVVVAGGVPIVKMLSPTPKHL